MFSNVTHALVKAKRFAFVIETQVFSPNPEASPAVCEKDQSVVLQPIADAELGKCSDFDAKPPDDFERDSILIGLGKIFRAKAAERVLRRAY